MRIFSAACYVGILALWGCGSDPEPGARTSEADVAADGEHIDCRIGDADAFARVCLLDRTSSTEGLVLTLHAPDGGFRRLLVTGDGRGVVAADGAEAARVRIAGDGLIEVALGSDRYRLPVTIKH